MVTVSNTQSLRQQRRRWLVRLFGRIFAIALLFIVLGSLYATISLQQSTAINDANKSSNLVTITAPERNDVDPCLAEYQEMTADRTPGLTPDDLERSFAYTGNRYRLAQFSQRLVEGKRPLHVVVCGGSISLGHGVTPITARYSDQLQYWFNDKYPIPSRPHRVLNMGSHGADMCAMAKRMNIMELPEDGPPDLFILEFAVNDYQGQDHRIHIDHKTDVFFDGFQQLAICAETVVHKILADFPHAAVVFLEFQTAILNRKTAQLLHMGVAQHYQVPLISYADTLWPDFYRLVDKLQEYDYSVPNHMDIHDVLPYPHGCAECQAGHIVAQFRDKGCKSVCVFMSRSGYHDGDCDVKNQPCYVPFLAHDAVHPSAVGHQIARDLIVEAIASVNLHVCHGRSFPDDRLPTHSGWLAAGRNYGDELRARSDFDLVLDTMEIFAKQHRLNAKEHSAGFQLKGDKFAERKGWIADNPKGGESITFEIDLPKHDCYAVFVAVLKSYETVGSFTVTVEDTVTSSITPAQTFDCIWKPRISIPADIQVTSDDSKVPGCSGKCKVSITTNPEIEGRGGNKIKIMSLSARKCIEKKQNR